MCDFYYQLRMNMINTMQDSLRQIRQVLDIGVQELANIVGLTRQTINNLENKKNKLSVTQYIAICAVIDHITQEQGIKFNVISAILESNKVSSGITDDITYNEDISLLKRWFSCFPDDSKLVSLPLANISIIDSEKFSVLAEDYKIFLDDTVLYENQFETFLDSVENFMISNEAKFIVPLIVIEKIQESLLSLNDFEANCAKKAITVLKKMQTKNLVEIRGEKNDRDINNTFVSVFAKFKQTNRLVLITQDNTLSNIISNLNHNELSGFNIIVTRLTENAELIKWEDYKNSFDVSKTISIVNNDDVESNNMDVDDCDMDVTDNNDINSDDTDIDDTDNGDENDENLTTDFYDAMKSWSNI